MLDRFTSTNNGTIVATSSLGLGLNLPNVDVVLYLGAPRSLEDYV